MKHELIERWHARLAGALDEALAELAACDESPLTDGMLCDWIRQLRTFRFEARHAPAILALIGKRDPHLQEAGIELAAAAPARVDFADDVERALAALLDGPVDPWVLHAIVVLLGRFVGPRAPQFTAVYRALVAYRPRPSSGRWIARNRHIDPLADLVPLYEQHFLQTLAPTERDQLLLPILEAKHGTRGFRPTVVAILESMGLHVERHFAVLGGR